MPPLAQTLHRYLAAAGPLLSAGELLDCQDAVARTATGRGPDAQARLEAFAEAEAADGSSWLSAEWLRGYLSVRTPLPLTSNVGFQIALPPKANHHGSADDDQDARSGTARAADVLHRLASVHLAHLRGELRPEVGPRGETMSSDQRVVLAGGLRHPAHDVDQVRLGNIDSRNREVGLLIQDRYVALPISDEHGHPLSPATLKQAIGEALALAEPLSRGDQHQDPGFTGLSYLGSEVAAPILARLLTEPANQRVYDRLNEALFVVNLIAAPAEALDHLKQTAFAPGQAWAYTPITYQVSLFDDFVGMHLEHSRVDAATLKVVLAHAQENTAGAQSSLAEPVKVEALDWVWTQPLASEVNACLRAYRTSAEQLRLDLVRVGRPVPADPTLRVSDDALCQWIMLYAQIATYGHIRSTYEAVDMRHYQAGRTECLRANTAEAVSLVRALIAQTADLNDLHQALAAHKQMVKQSKTGQAVDRHLSGLAMITRGAGLALPIFDDPAYSRLNTDFLSTTSIGDQHHIVRMAFAPTSPGGIGLNYTPTGDDYEFLVSSTEETASIEAFLAQLRSGALALAALVASAPARTTEPEDNT